MPSDESSRVPGDSAAEACPAPSSSESEALETLLDDPAFGETELCRLLERKDLSTVLLERIAARKEWLGNRQVRLALVAHPHAPRRVALRLAREVHLMDLVGVSLSPAAPPEVRRFVEDLLVSRLPQLPLGQKLALARRGSARVAGALLAEGHERVALAAIENSRLTEAQVLRVLAGSELSPQTITAVGAHAKWLSLPAVRAAVLRHPRTPLPLALSMLPALSRRDLEESAAVPELRPEIRKAIRERLADRTP